MKRPREQAEAIDANLAALLMLLSGNVHTVAAPDPSSGRMFECKTCNRQFPSFQALGGHRASHKKPRLPDSGEGSLARPSNPRVHECSICGLEFALGQALGGHMRRHRAELDGSMPVPHRIVHRAAVEVAEHDDELGSTITLDLNMPAPLENDPLLTLRLGLPFVH